VNRLWSRVGIRVTSVGLLVLGIVAGVYFGQHRTVQQRSAETKLVVQADAEEEHLLKQRQSQHAAARAWQRQAESDAAAKAAAEAKAAAGKARTLEKKAIDKKIADKKAADEKAAKEKEKSSSSSGGGESVPFSGDIPASCDEFSGNRATGCALMLEAGFKIDQFSCLNKLWNRESGWSTSAYNSGSGAGGIPQALPMSKMKSEGADYKTNAATQIRWGLKYIKGRWNTPCGAWAHSESSGWY
jgi:hypothetical protein